MARKTNTNILGKDYYRIRKVVGHKPNGDPILKNFYGSCEKEANKKADEYIEKLKKGVITKKNKTYTINILFPEWLFNVKINEIKSTSFEAYECIYRNHIEPYDIANQDITQIKSIMIQNFYNKLSRNGTSASNIKKVHKLLNPFFKYVEKDGYIVKNPCSNVTLPKDKNISVAALIEKQKIPFKYFKPDEVKILREAFADNKYKDVVDFALGTGTREGEIAGLKKTQLNFDEREISITSNNTTSAVFNDNREKIGYETKDGTPKTESSIDVIPMSDFIYNLLINLPDNPDSEYVFTIDGHQIDKKDLQKVWKKVLKELCKKYKGFTYRVFHDLRHTFAVLLLLNGVDLYTIMKLMRHKKLSSTEIYLAVLPETKETSVNKLNHIFNWLAKYWLNLKMAKKIARCYISVTLAITVLQAFN